MKKRLAFLFIVCSLSLISVHAQKIDSLLHVLKTEKEDTNKVNTLNDIAFSLVNIKPDSAVLLAKQASALAVKLGMTEGEANAYRNMGLGYSDEGDYVKASEYDLKALNIYKELGDKQGQINALSSVGVVCYYRGDYPQAVDYDKEALSISEETGNKKAQASALGNIGIVYYGQGDYPKALDYYLKALKIKEELGNKQGQANTLGNIGIVYDDQGDYAKALTYYQKALKMDEELGNKNGQAADLSNIGIVYNELGDRRKSLDYYQQALKLNEELEFKQGEAYSLGNIGDIYLEFGMAPGVTRSTRDSAYSKALDYYNRSLKMAEEIGDKRGIASHMSSLGVLYTKTGKFKEAEEYLKKAIVLDSSIGEQNYLKNNESNLSLLYETAGQYKQALEHYKKATMLKDSLFNIDKNKALTSKELNYQFEKKEAAAKAEQDKKDAITAAEKHKQLIITILVSVGLLLVMVFAALIFRSLQVTRKQKSVIEIKNKETEGQKKVIEEKNKDILDSITYAKRLQDAILPPLSLIKQHLPESFLLYKPKDIVAGDFYWMEIAPLNPPERGISQGTEPSFGGQGGRIILIAACDCTGHGVPGAMTSVVCSNALNRALNEFKIYDTGRLLDKTRELVLETFAKSEGEIKDGMDISLLSITRPHLTSYAPNPKVVHQGGLKTSNGGKEDAQIIIKWSGAYNPLWYVVDGKIVEIQADKQPIGRVDNPKPFTTHTFTLSPQAGGQRGAALYLFTDGFADQFGGPKGKKFKYKQLQQLIMDNAQLTMEEQKQILEKTFNDWKGNLEQTDDVCIIGIRI